MESIITGSRFTAEDVSDWTKNTALSVSGNGGLGNLD